MSDRGESSKSAYSLDEIREILEKAEDSIIFALCERSQWKANINVDFFNTLLQNIEKVQARVGRYACPEETPFTDVSRYSILFDKKKIKVAIL